MIIYVEILMKFLKGRAQLELMSEFSKVTNMHNQMIYFCTSNEQLEIVLYFVSVQNMKYR